MGDAFFRHQGAEAGLEMKAELVEAGESVGRAAGKLLELGESGRHGQRVAGKRARLIDRADGRDHVHHIRAPAEGTDGKSAADHFPEAGKIRCEVLQALHARLAEAEAGHHFIENEERAVLFRDRGKQLQVSGFRENEAGVGGVGLDDDCGDLIPHFLEEPGERLGIVVGKDDGFFRKRFRHARGIGLAVGERS